MQDKEYTVIFSPKHSEYVFYTYLITTQLAEDLKHFDQVWFIFDGHCIPTED